MRVLQASKDYKGSSTALVKSDPHKPQAKPQPTKEEIKKTLTDIFGF